MVLLEKLKFAVLNKYIQMRDLVYTNMSIFVDKLHGHIQVVIYIYAVLKYIFNKYTNGSKFPKLSAVLSILLSPVIFVILLALRIYRLAVHTILKVQLGTKYYQLLPGTDTIFLLTECKQARSVITTLLYINYQGSPKDFYNDARSEIAKVFSLEKFQKSLCVRKQFMGYYYYEKIRTNFDEFFNVIEYGDAAEFNSILGDVANFPFPHNDTAMWDVFIGTKQLDNEELPLVFRFHHCFGDAVTVFNLFSREFSKNITDIKNTENSASLQKAPHYTSVSNSFMKAFGYVDDPDKSILSGNMQLGQKHLVWFSEETPKYLQLIKNIKRKVGNVTFVDVVLTAFSASLSNFVKQKTDIFPEFIAAIVTFYRKNIDFATYGTSDYEISNKFTIGMTKLPLKVIDSTNLLDRLQLVAKDYGVLKHKSLDCEFNRWQATVLVTLLPRCVSSFIVNMCYSTVVFSNIPGCKKLKLFGKNDVTKFIILDPNSNKAGISLMVTTYDDKLNIAFTIDKGIIPDMEDVKQIRNNLLTYLNDLYSLT